MKANQKYRVNLELTNDEAALLKHFMELRTGESFETLMDDNETSSKKDEYLEGLFIGIQQKILKQLNRYKSIDYNIYHDPELGKIGVDLIIWNEDEKHLEVGCQWFDAEVLTAIEKSNFKKGTYKIPGCGDTLEWESSNDRKNISLFVKEYDEMSYTRSISIQALRAIIKKARQLGIIK
jgi:hypothetical protein